MDYLWKSFCVLMSSVVSVIKRKKNRIKKRQLVMLKMAVDFFGKLNQINAPHLRLLMRLFTKQITVFLFKDPVKQFKSVLTDFFVSLSVSLCQVLNHKS